MLWDNSAYNEEEAPHKYGKGDPPSEGDNMLESNIL